MLAIALYQPEIPPNTGNLIRLAANMGAELHLIEPLGFSLDDKRVRRAGLDYGEAARVIRHADFSAFQHEVASRRVYACSTRATQAYTAPAYQDDDVLLFGPETRGLPDAVLNTLPSSQRLRVPMCAGSRSLNLSNAAAIVAFEAWRQLRFAGAIGVSDD